ncbi:MAG: DUF433 domain-containing protein [Nostoc sp. NOS(2021)]|uniref:DUF433 domain-containing protein n=1 Tax=Nostoc sp. NOS(2021) TaxID=2815407 RepID=UPI0025E2B089|nr:DUF433 domain-containing protein [Nostoc sp. NOS(2021)]MBN3898926.1 DUF433 domain-containing protein [Nostoc sp. NOS(2021)]
MAVAVNIGSLIDSHPGIHGGTPLIAGTGVTVRRIAIWHNGGHSIEEIAHEIGHLNLAQVYAALTHYYANKNEIDVDIAADEAEYDRLLALHRYSKQS